MTKTKTQGSTDAQDVTKKQRKKQAKREARLMLKLEQARRSVQKVEQKAAKARSKLEANEKRLQEFEQQLAQLHEPQSESVGTNGTQYVSEVDSGDRFDVSMFPDQEESIPPAEGREDLSIPHDDQETSVTDELLVSAVEAVEGGVPVQTNGEHVESSGVSEEIAEAVTETTTPINADQVATVVSEETIAPEVEQAITPANEEAVAPIVEEIVSTIVEKIASTPVDDVTSPGEESVSPEAQQATDQSR